MTAKLPIDSSYYSLIQYLRDPLVAVDDDLGLLERLRNWLRSLEDLREFFELHGKESITGPVNPELRTRQSSKPGLTVRFLVSTKNQ